MTNINYYIEKIKLSISPQKKDKEKIQITPYRDWKIIVLTFFSLTVLLSGGTIYTFYVLNEREVVGQEQNGLVPVETIDRNSMQKTIEAFDGRGTRLADLLSKKPKKVDPSL